MSNVSEDRLTAAKNAAKNAAKARMLNSVSGSGKKRPCGTWPVRRREDVAAGNDGHDYREPDDRRTNPAMERSGFAAHVDLALPPVEDRDDAVRE